MNEPLKANEVISQILFELGVNPNKFATSIGVTATQIYDIMNSKVKSITTDMADKIRSVYPLYSKAWLMSGEGEPHIAEKNVPEKNLPDGTPMDQDKSDGKNVVAIYSICHEFIQEIAAQRETCAKMVSDERNTLVAQMDAQLKILASSIEQVNILIQTLKK